MPLVTATFTTGGNVIIDEAFELAVLESLVLQLTALNAAIGVPGGVVPGTALAIASATQGTLANIYAQLQSMDNRLKEVSGQVTDLNGQMEKSRTGLAKISTHIGEQSVVQKMALLDQVKHNEFQQQTTNASLKDAGKPPTVVTPTAFVAKVESTLKDLTTINAQTTIVNTVTEYSTSTLTKAYEESLSWAAQTEIGGWIIKQWAKAKLAITQLFAAEKVKETARDVNQSALNLKGGNPTTITEQT
jgi:hypothetical protein